MEFLPNLFLLGAMKSGTTALHEYLSSMPEICMSSPKEPFFFECEFDKGLSFYREKYFSHWKGENFIGESRHQNLYLPFIPERIRQINEAPYLIVILRNPVERAYAHWWHWFSRNVEKRKFPVAIQQELVRIEEGKSYKGEEGKDLYCKHLNPDGSGFYSTYVDTGYYAVQLERYLDLFPKERLLILFTEDLLADKFRELNKVREFLSLPELSPSQMDLKSKVNKHKSKEVPDWILTIAEHSPLKLLGSGSRSKLYKAFRNKFFSRASMDRDTEALLIEHFAGHNERLSQITGRDLSSWNRTHSSQPIQNA